MEERKWNLDKLQTKRTHMGEGAPQCQQKALLPNAPLLSAAPHWFSSAISPCLVTEHSDWLRNMVTWSRSIWNVFEGVSEETFSLFSKPLGWFLVICDICSWYRVRCVKTQTRWHLIKIEALFVLLLSYKQQVKVLHKKMTHQKQETTANKTENIIKHSLKTW